MEHELYGAEDAAIAARATRDDDAQEASEQAIAREAPKRGSVNGSAGGGASGWRKGDASLGDGGHQTGRFYF